jgi:hypothetical protein
LAYGYGSDAFNTATTWWNGPPTVSNDPHSAPDTPAEIGGPKLDQNGGTVDGIECRLGEGVGFTVEGEDGRYYNNQAEANAAQDAAQDVARTKGSIASQELIDRISKDRQVFVAKDGTDDLKFLDMMQADASAGGPGNLSILIREDPQKITLIEEFCMERRRRFGVN